MLVPFSLMTLSLAVLGAETPTHSTFPKYKLGNLCEGALKAYIQYVFLSACHCIWDQVCQELKKKIKISTMGKISKLIFRNIEFISRLIFLLYI